ncbi:MAG: thioredoxin family protein [Candidatus Heimdallarchaeota archaeon]
MKLSKKTKQHLVLSIFVVVLVLIVVGEYEQKKHNTPEQLSQKIQWFSDLDTTLALANEQHKPIMIDFTAKWCLPCLVMDDSTFSHPDVVRKAALFIPVRIDVDKQPDIAKEYLSEEGIVGLPYMLFMTDGRRKLKQLTGYQGPERLVAVMDSVLGMTK